MRCGCVASSERASSKPPATKEPVEHDLHEIEHRLHKWKLGVVHGLISGRDASGISPSGSDGVCFAFCVCMTKLTLVVAVSFASTVLGGCAVSAAPDSASDVTADTANVTPHSVSPISPVAPITPITFCIPPITPMVGEWSCGASGIRTGDKMVTSTAGYTDNCAGRITVEYTTPKCAVPAPQQFDEIHINAVGLSVSTAAACTSSYLDYTISALSTATNTWSTLESTRVHGTYLSDGTCILDIEADPVSAAWSQFEISADAYEPVSLFFGGRPISFFAPVNVSIDASFIQ
jgi:hypothetical protein